MASKRRNVDGADIEIIKLEPPIHGTGHHQFHYKATFVGNAVKSGYGQTEREAILDLRGK